MKVKVQILIDWIDAVEEAQAVKAQIEKLHKRYEQALARVSNAEGALKMSALAVRDFSEKESIATELIKQLSTTTNNAKED